MLFVKTGVKHDISCHLIRAIYPRRGVGPLWYSHYAALPCLSVVSHDHCLHQMLQRGQQRWEVMFALHSAPPRRHPSLPLVFWDLGSVLHPYCIEAWTFAAAWLFLPPSVIAVRTSQKISVMLWPLCWVCCHWDSRINRSDWSWFLISFFSLVSDWDARQNAVWCLWKEGGLQQETETGSCIRKWAVTKLRFLTAWGWSEMKICPPGSWPICKKTPLL